MVKGDYSCMCGSDRCFTCHQRENRQRVEAKKRALGLKPRDKMPKTMPKTNQDTNKPLGSGGPEGNL